MKKHLLLVGMAGDMNGDAVEKLKANLGRDLVDREVHIIQNALFMQEVVVDVERGQKRHFLIVGMGIHMTTKQAETTRAVIREWLPDHEVRFIVGGFCAAELTIDIANAVPNQNGYL